ncbi:MAG: cation-translocating P-type ATPase [Candidatus Limnocylindrales bacterium]
MNLTPRPRPGARVADPADDLASRAAQLPPGSVLERLGTDPAFGLTSEQTSARLSEFGPNELEPVRNVSLLRLLWDGAREPFVVLLFVAGCVAIALNEVRDGLLVLVILAPIVLAGVITEYRGERALETLREAAASFARVRRAGLVDDVPTRELVRGDIVLLRTGDVVPADLKLIRVDALTFDRSALTGESLPEPASAAPDPEGAALADCHSIAYAGTAVVGGRGEGAVVATGLATEFGRISQALAGRERRRSPLQRELDRLVRILLFVAIGLIAIVVTLGFARGNDAGKNLLAGVSAAIAAIPEEPPALVAVVLGLGAYRLLRMNVLVRRLSAQETLGSVDLIVTDKTGTLTENRLALAAIRTPAGVVEDRARVTELAILAVRAEEDAWSVATGAKPGSFTRSIFAFLAEQAVVLDLDPADLLDADPVSDDRPFSRTRARRQTTDRPASVEELALGAPEAVLAMCEALPPGERDAWRDLVESGAEAGERLLLLARCLDGEAWLPLAVLAFADRIRPGIREAMALARTAGIQPLVVTGDHPATAAAIAADAGLPNDRVVTGPQLAAWDDARLAAELPTLNIVARAVPEQKLRIVDVARSSNRTVAVTGDGVNDAPALHHADVAVAMGSGTAVAREASDLVLGDDSFVTLMHGLREGRRLVANVQKGLVFLISTHVAMLGFILIATVAGFSQPLLPIQILWLEVFIDLLTAVSFEGEAEEPGAMNRPPRLRTRPLLDWSILARITLAGGFSAAAALVLIEQHSPDFEHARWLAYTALVVGQVVRANANRSLSYPVLLRRPNALLLAGGVLSIAVQAGIPFVPAAREAFQATPLDAFDWLLVAIVALTPAAFAEVYRAIRHKPWVA